MTEPLDAIIERVKARDPQALAEYLAAKTPALLAFIERNLSHQLRRKIEAQDLLQETSLYAVHALAEADLADRDVFSWLCQIAERKIIDAHRRLVAAQKRAANREIALQGARGDDQEDLVNLLVRSITTPSAVFSRNQKEFRLLQALAQLPAESQTAIRLRYVEGLPSKEIAQQLGKSDGAVRVILTRALKKLQAELGDDTLFQS